MQSWGTPAAEVLDGPQALGFVELTTRGDLSLRARLAIGAQQPRSMGSPREIPLGEALVALRLPLAARVEGLAELDTRLDEPPLALRTLARLPSPEGPTLDAGFQWPLVPLAIAQGSLQLVGRSTWRFRGSNSPPECEGPGATPARVRPPRPGGAVPSSRTP